MGKNLAEQLGIQTAVLSRLSTGKLNLLKYEQQCKDHIVPSRYNLVMATQYWVEIKEAYCDLEELDEASELPSPLELTKYARRFLFREQFLTSEGVPTAAFFEWKANAPKVDYAGERTVDILGRKRKKPPSDITLPSAEKDDEQLHSAPNRHWSKKSGQTSGNDDDFFPLTKPENMTGMLLQDKVLRNHLRPWVKAEVLEELVELSHTVVTRYNENPSADVKQTILVEAKKAGFFEDQSDQSWFEAGLIAGLRPRRESAQGTRSNLEEYADAFEEEWYLDPELAEELLVKFENEAFLKKKRDQLLAEGKKTRKTRRFLEILNVTLMQKAVVDDFMPIPIALNHILACNSHEASQTLLKIVLCKHFLIAGRAQYAAPLMLELGNSSNLSQQGHFLDIRYNLLNASYPLRSVELYGSSDVSKSLLSSEFKSSLMPEKQPDWSNFDAYSLIIELCSKNGIDTGRYDTAYLQRLADEFGTTGPRMIYKFYCEKLLRSTDKSVFADHLKTCITIMKNFSGVVRSDTYGKPFFTTPSWLPITLLNATCHNFGYTDLAEYVDETFTRFEGWSNQNLLMADVERMRQQGSFGTSIHLVNQARTLVSQNKQDEARDLLERYKNAFRHIRNMPTIAQNAAPLFEVLGIKLKGIDRALVVGEPGGNSYSNYIARCP